MFTPTQFERFADACSGIADEASDENGFVSVQTLLTKFHADITIRPLLVEAMLAFSDKQNASDISNKWAVLLDSETYGIDIDDIYREEYLAPLPSRLRNTIAHELVHSLAFRFSEFGIQLQIDHKNEKDRETLVKDIESETESLSPLLLCSTKALRKFFQDRPDNLSVSEYDSICQKLGISKYVLINRLLLLRKAGPKRLLESSGLRNTAIGIGEWKNSKEAVLLGWPLFTNFDRDHIPTFLFGVAQQDRMPAKAIFTDSSFVLCGGESTSISISTTAGTRAVPDAETITVECSIGEFEKTAGSTFLYEVRKPFIDHSLSRNRDQRRTFSR